MSQMGGGEFELSVNIVLKWFSHTRAVIEQLGAGGLLLSIPATSCQKSLTSLFSEAFSNRDQELCSNCLFSQPIRFYTPFLF